jgi:hypothetical protein
VGRGLFKFQHLSKVTKLEGDRTSMCSWVKPQADAMMSHRVQKGHVSHRVPQELRMSTSYLSLPAGYIVIPSCKGG